MENHWILSQQHNRVLTLTLNRPEVRNALSTACLELLVQHLEQAQINDEVGAIVITGNPRFSQPVPTLKNYSNKPLRMRSPINAHKFGAGYP